MHSQVRLLTAHRPAAFLFENVAGLVLMEGGSRGRPKAPLGRAAGKQGGEEAGKQGGGEAGKQSGGEAGEQGGVAKQEASVEGSGEPDGSVEVADADSSCSADADASSFVPGATFTHIVGELEGCGYDVSWRVVNCESWLPQSRERVYIVGFRRDLGAKMEWGAVRGEAAGCTLRQILLPQESDEAAACELTPLQWEAVRAQAAAFPRWNGRPCPISERALCLDGKAPTLASQYHRVSGYSTKFVFDEAGDRAGDRAGDGAGGRRPRFLAPRECARLMGFPDDFPVPRVADGDPHAPAAFYRQIGNAVCPPVIRAIGAEMVRQLDARCGASGWTASPTTSSAAGIYVPPAVPLYTQ